MQNAAGTAANDSVAMTAEAMRLCLSGDPERGIELLREVSASNPDDVRYLVNLGCALCQAGQLREGAETLQRAFRLSDDDEHIRQNYQNALHALYNQSAARGDHIECLWACRSVYDLWPENHEVQLDLYNALAETKEPALLSDFTNRVRPEELGKKVFIACMPKSGSSWLYQALITLTGFAGTRLSQAFLQNEQEIYLPKLVETAADNVVTQQHARATDPNIALLQAFGIKPVVLVRNLFDALVSMHDFYDNGAVLNTFHQADWPNLDAQTRLDLIVDCVTPWYIQFYASWFQADATGRLPVFWLSYEDMMADKTETLANLGAFYDLNLSRASIDQAISALEGDVAKTRFNKGVAGRGAKTFSAEQQDRIRRFTTYYPSVDFSPIGL